MIASANYGLQFKRIDGPLFGPHIILPIYSGMTLEVQSSTKSILELMMYSQNGKSSASTETLIYKKPNWFELQEWHILTTIPDI